MAVDFAATHSRTARGLLLAFAFLAAGCMDGEAPRWTESVELLPGSGHEIDLELASRAVVEWAWQTDAPVRFDIHTHHDDGTVETFIAVTDTVGEGTFTAPLDAAYSWYWTHEAGDPVALQLRVLPVKSAPIS